MGNVADADAAVTDGGRPSHLNDFEDGCGCAEVWEHLSDRRANTD